MEKVRTSVTPTRDCPKDKHFWSSATVRCNGSGMRAIMNVKYEKQLEREKGSTLQMPQAALHSSLVAET